MLLTDIIIDGIPEIDWTLHIPIMLHILFLGLDHTRPIVRDHCKQLLLNCLVVLSEHNDHLTVAKILLNAQTSKMGLGLPIPTLPVSIHNFTGTHHVQTAVNFKISLLHFILFSACSFRWSRARSRV